MVSNTKSSSIQQVREILGESQRMSKLRHSACVRVQSKSKLSTTWSSKPTNCSNFGYPSLLDCASLLQRRFPAPRLRSFAETVLS